MLSLLIASTIAAGAAPGACFWTYPRDLPISETNVRYWRADFRLAPGEKLEVKGQYPHARQMSFNLHRSKDNGALGSLPDIQIKPDEGSVNPFVPGNRRDVRRRSYTVRIQGDILQGRTINTLAAATAGDFDGRVLFRSYLPDRAAPGGGVPLPRVWRISADGARAEITGQCPDPASVITDQVLGPTRNPPSAGTPDSPITWLGASRPAGEATADVLINRDNAYAYALTDMRLGEVLILRGRAPSHPTTWAGDKRMLDGQVRYWSLCAYRNPSDRSVRCVADEEIPLDARGDYTIVVSTRQNRPSNAQARCGVAWLDAMTDELGALILRHVAPSADFVQTPSHVPSGVPAADVLGAYEPRGEYSSRSDFESRGCSGV
jgi:hypothetical protein